MNCSPRVKIPFMRNSLLIIIFVAIFQLSASAQSTPDDSKTSRCLTGITVTISPELVETGEIMTATLEFDQSERSDFTFHWTASNGTIVEGQGTRKIKFKHKKGAEGQSLSVTATIGGLPKDCQTSASASPSVAKIVCRLPMIFDDYSKEPLEREKARLDNFAAQIIVDKTNIGLLLLTSDTTNQAKINSRIKKVFSYLNGVRKIEPSRLKFALSADERQRTQLYIFPQDSVFVPDFYKLISDEDLAKITSPQTTKRRKSC